MPRFNFFSDAFYPDWTGGLQRYATELAVEAGKQGHEGALWTREWRRAGLQEVFAEVGAAFSVHDVTHRVPSRLRGAALLICGILSFGRVKLKADYAIFHTAVIGAAFMPRRSRKPQIYVFHASAAHELLVEAASRGSVSAVTRIKAETLFYLERRCITSADAVVVLSEFSRGLLRDLHPRHSPRRLVMIPGGTRIPEVASLPARHTSSEGRRRIVVLRRLEWRMGIDILLQAFAASSARQEGWILDIVGTGSQLTALRTQADELGLGESTVFHGRVSEEKRASLLDDASLSVLPTRALEGFGLATVEAMARGVVPVVTSAGASPELVRELSSRLICEPTPESLRDAIDYWAVECSPTRLAELGEACRLRARAYGWEPVFHAYEALLKDLSQAANLGPDDGLTKMFG